MNDNVINLVLLAILVIATLLGLALTGYGVRNIIDARKSKSWPTVDGEITRSVMTEKLDDDSRTRYTLHIKYKYTIDRSRFTGKQFTGHRIWFSSHSFYDPTVRPLLSYVVTRVARRIYSHTTWLIFVRELSLCTDDKYEKLLRSHGLHIKLADKNDIDNIVDAYPLELRLSKTRRSLRKDVSAQISQGITCFILLDENNRVIGGRWCIDSSISPLNDYNDCPEQKWFESSATFLQPDYRGKGLNQLFQKLTDSEMFHSGYRFALSHIRTDRTGSIRTILLTGARLIGTKSHRTILGKRKWQYSQPSNDVVRLVESLKNKPVRSSGAV